MVILCFLVCAISALGDGAAGPATNGSLFLSAQQMHSLLHSGDPRIQKVFARIVKDAEVLTDKPPEIPDKGGGWIFDLYCSKDNTRLQRIGPSRFRCPSENREENNEKAEASYRTTLHDAASHGANSLAWAYVITGNKAFAEGAGAILSRYADFYDGYVRHDRWGRTGFLAFMGGKRYAQALDEAVNIIPCCEAYSLIRDSGILSESQRAHIENDFLRATAEQLKVPTFQQDNNHQTWINAGMASIGAAINDGTLLTLSLEGTFGALYQMNKCVTSDGLWYEGTMAYHSYALQALVMHAQILANAGIPDLIQHPKLRSLFDGPMLESFPDGNLPINNDSDPFNIRSMADYYEWAYATFDTAASPATSYGAVAALGGRQGVWAWKIGRPQLPEATTTFWQGSRNLLGMGLIFIDSHVNGSKPLSMVIDYGPHGGSHGHPDKLSIALEGFGRDLFVDPGRLTYSVPEYKSWSLQTIAHNTVVIDETSQTPASGSCEWFITSGDVDAALLQTDAAYPGVTLQRMIAKADGYYLDCYRVTSRDMRQIDWTLHLRGILQETNLLEVTTVRGWSKKDGYKHFKNIRQGITALPSVLSWKIAGNKGAMRMIFPETTGKEQWLIADGIGTHIGDTVPCLIRRVKDKEALLISVYEINPGKTTGSITSITCDNQGDESQPLALRVQGTSWTDEWVIPWKSSASSTPQRLPIPPPSDLGFSCHRKQE